MNLCSRKWASWVEFGENPPSAQQDDFHAWFLALASSPWVSCSTCSMCHVQSLTLHQSHGVVCPSICPSSPWWEVLWKAICIHSGLFFHLCELHHVLLIQTGAWFCLWSCDPAACWTFSHARWLHGSMWLCEEKSSKEWVSEKKPLCKPQKQTPCRHLAFSRSSRCRNEHPERSCPHCFAPGQLLQTRFLFFAEGGIFGVDHHCFHTKCEHMRGTQNLKGNLLLWIQIGLFPPKDNGLPSAIGSWSPFMTMHFVLRGCIFFHWIELGNAVEHMTCCCATQLWFCTLILKFSGHLFFVPTTPDEGIFLKIWHDGGLRRGPALKVWVKELGVESKQVTIIVEIVVCFLFHLAHNQWGASLWFHHKRNCELWNEMNESVKMQFTRQTEKLILMVAPAWFGSCVSSKKNLTNGRQDFFLQRWLLPGQTIHFGKWPICGRWTLMFLQCECWFVGHFVGRNFYFWGAIFHKPKLGFLPVEIAKQFLFTLQINFCSLRSEIKNVSPVVCSDFIIFFCRHGILGQHWQAQTKSSFFEGKKREENCSEHPHCQCAHIWSSLHFRSMHLWIQTRHGWLHQQCPKGDGRGTVLSLLGGCWILWLGATQSAWFQRFNHSV